MTLISPRHREGSMRFAYADPPYPGQSRRHYKHHADFGGEVDHAELIPRLIRDFPDGWALSTSVQALPEVLAACPTGEPSKKNPGRKIRGTGVRVLAWCKPQFSWKPVHPQQAWEPVILYRGRWVAEKGDLIVRDWVAASPRTESVPGAKPLEFCHWVFRCLGARGDDELVDLFPGSGAVGRAWDAYRGQMELAA